MTNIRPESNQRLFRLADPVPSPARRHGRSVTEEEGAGLPSPRASIHPRARRPWPASPRSLHPHQETTSAAAAAACSSSSSSDQISGTVRRRREEERPRKRERAPGDVEREGTGGFLAGCSALLVNGDGWWRWRGNFYGAQGLAFPILLICLIVVRAPKLNRNRPKFPCANGIPPCPSVALFLFVSVNSLSGKREGNQSFGLCFLSVPQRADCFHLSLVLSPCSQE